MVTPEGRVDIVLLLPMAGATVMACRRIHRIFVARGQFEVTAGLFGCRLGI